MIDVTEKRRGREHSIEIPTTNMLQEGSLQCECLTAVATGSTQLTYLKYNTILIVIGTTYVESLDDER